MGMSAVQILYLRNFFEVSARAPTSTLLATPLKHACSPLRGMPHALDRELVELLCVASGAA